jgi:hypothetical protein
MKTISIETAKEFIANERMTSFTVSSFEKNEVRNAFCSIHFDYQNGGAGVSYTISKKTYKAICDFIKDEVRLLNSYAHSMSDFIHNSDDRSKQIAADYAVKFEQKLLLINKMNLKGVLKSDVENAVSHFNYFKK